MDWPTFFVLGAPRAGTTALYAALRQHPQIVMSRIKEPHFFAYGELEPLPLQGPASQMMAKQIVRTQTDYAALFSQQTNAAPNRVVSGEASMTNFLPRACARIQHYVPAAKLIVILRHPAERAYSQFVNARRLGWEPLADFEAALAAEPIRLAQQWIPALCYTYRGNYAARLAPYLAAFAPAQIRIYRYETWQKTPQGLLQDLFAFLDVDPTFVPTVNPRLNAGQLPRYPWWQARWRQFARGQAGLKWLLPAGWRRNVAAHLRAQTPPPPLPAHVRQQLIRAQRAEIEQLQIMLEQDFSTWLV